MTKPSHCDGFCVLVFKTTVSRADSQSWTPEFPRRFNHLFIDSGVFWGPSKAGGAVESTLVFVYNNYVTGILPSFFFFIISPVKPVAFRAPFCFHSQQARCSPNLYFDFEISAISISKGGKNTILFLTNLLNMYVSLQNYWDKLSPTNCQTWLKEAF